MNRNSYQCYNCKSFFAPDKLEKGNCRTCVWLVPLGKKKQLPQKTNPELYVKMLQQMLEMVKEREA